MVVTESLHTVTYMRNTAATGDGGSNGTFFKVVLLVRREKYDEALEYVERARKCLATKLAALIKVRFDFQFGVSPKILDPVYPVHEFPLPLHLAESGLG
ncbi:hypothetical protein Lser_V15G45449 [Lactuca serriola]